VLHFFIRLRIPDWGVRAENAGIIWQRFLILKNTDYLDFLDLNCDCYSFNHTAAIILKR
jgi:hypothetical protein